MPQKISLENALKRCGHFDRFQWIHYMFLSLVTVGSGITTYYYVFGVAEPSFRCRLPSDIWPYDDQFEPINASHQLLADTWQSTLSSKCDGLNRSTCNDFVYDRRVFGRTFTEEAHLVCSNAVKKTWLSTTYQIGGFVVLLTGSISDKVGRRKMIQALTILLVIIPLLTQILLQTVDMSVDVKFTVLAINQFLSSVDAYPMVYLLLMELTTSAHTSLAGNIALLGFTLGEILITIFAYLARDWLRLKWIITVYFTLILPYLYFVPESPYWLFSKKKYNELEACLQKIATKNGRLNSEWHPYYLQLIRDPRLVMKSSITAARTNREKLLLHIPRLIISAIMGFITMLLYIKISYGLGTMSDTVSPHWNTIIGAVVEGIGYTSASLIITTKLGRKYGFILYTFLTSIFVLIIPFVMDSYSIVTTVISQIGKLLISGSVSITWIYVPELFPTSMRGFANGIFVFVSRCGAILAPIVDAALGDELIKITFMSILH